MPYEYNDAGMMWGQGLIGLLLLLVVLAAIAWFVLTLSHSSSHTHHGISHTPSPPQPPASDALKILNERFARGEIDADEFTKRRDLLKGSS